VTTRFNPTTGEVIFIYLCLRQQITSTLIGRRTHFLRGRHCLEARDPAILLGGYTTARRLATERMRTCVFESVGSQK